MGDVITGVAFKPRRSTIKGDARRMAAEALRLSCKPVGFAIVALGEDGKMILRTSYYPDQIKEFDLLARAESCIVHHKSKALE